MLKYKPYMNIIPFIISLLLIFAISTNTLIKKKVSDDLVCKSISGYMSASRKSLNNSEDYYFKSIKKNSSNKPKKEKKSKDPLKKKARQINIENAKINIYPLIMDEKENQIELYNLIASLIKTLYSNKSFYKNNLEKDLLNNILYALEIQVKKNNSLHLANLFLKDSTLQNIYYKILKGTKFYDFDKEIGLPSLLDYVKIENTKNKIPIKDVSYELLLSVFNKNIAKEINTLQKEFPIKNLTKENIKNLCQKYHFRFNEKILDFFDFSNSLINLKEKIIVGIDETTNIKVKRKITL